MSDLPRQDALVDELLYGFDILDDETREFLSSVIASGRAPPAEVDELLKLSLMRGVEDWDSMFECAEALRDKSRGDGLGAERSLVPFLGAVMGGSRAGESEVVEREGRAKAKGTRKGTTPGSKGLEKGVSPFWGEVGKDDGEAGAGRRRREAGSFGMRNERNERNALVERLSQSPKGITESEAQDSSSASSPADTEVRGVTNETPSDTVIKESRSSPVQLSLPSRPARTSPELPRKLERPVKATGATRSPFFSPSTPTTPAKQQPQPDSTPSTKKKPCPPRGTVSSLPIPPLSAPHFGLIQEELASDPFRLLVAVTFLIRTAGKAAIPVFRQLMERLPTPEALAAASPEDIVPLIRPLGLSAVRCAAIQKYARLWLERPPSREVRYGVKNYPRPGDGRCVRAGEELGPEDLDGDSDGGGGGGHGLVDAVADARERAVESAWEIGHLTQGPYALDSWRIFCRDVLLGRSGHWTGSGEVAGFQPEWMRVLPRDKELRACLRWMWYVSLSLRGSSLRLSGFGRRGLVILDSTFDAWSSWTI